ncbi:MAG: Rrf2 family transcriptional regulator [Phascolarctobacterium sp.]|uniref:Rrf2 family transcriptional regulator n=1 Tax=Phascolarctobacterium sp. TaxID=2049039 RepID=UPI0026DB8A2F|nr:Rrf2 family transcriptional regulator [Phascolarctobacterium sp.]MDO4921822.1 Rrf2 family transcriptional regulator [Phascolarctobacterium sp.]
MQFSSRFTIAVHIMLCLVRFGGEYKLTSNFLAGSVNVNPVIIRKILGQLKEAGLVDVEAGVGGASLRKTPQEITLQDIFFAVEGQEQQLFHFHEQPNPACPVGKRVHLLLDAKLAAAKRALENSLRGVTLQSLANELAEDESRKR